jgi:hypothetical protein
MTAARTLEQEQDAFEQQLDALLPDHAGEWVLFKDGKPMGFFADHVEAYEAGLKRFGLDVPFLVQQVTRHNGEVVSLAWEAGVMLG